MLNNIHLNKNNKKLNSNFFILIFFLFILIKPIFAFNIGVSPGSIIILNEEKLFLINSNNYDINYEIKGCDYDFVEIIRKGTISKLSTRDLTLRVKNVNNKVDSCNLNLFFSNDFYATAISIPVLISSIHNDNFFEFNSPDSINEKRNYIPIIIGVVLFLISLAVILFYF
ncbi:MAG: hypothetical protein ACMXYG_02230 [Candidatus Woesearchaeota archaeon]